MNIDVRELVESAGLEVEPSGAEYLLCCCPLEEHEDKNPSFSISIDNGRWRCFGCHGRGDLLSLMSVLWKCDREAARQRVYGDDRNRPAGPVERIEEALALIAKEADQAADYSEPDVYALPDGAKRLVEGEPAYEYAIGRGLSHEIIRKHNLFTAPEYPNWLYIPFDLYGQCRGWCRRDMTGLAERKYMMAGGMSPSVMFNLDGICGKEEVFLVEGAIDAMRIMSVLPDLPVVAALTSKLSEVKEYWLSKMGVRTLVLAFDNDEAGQAGIRQIVKAVDDAFQIKLCLPPQLDWGACSNTEVQIGVRGALEVGGKSTSLRRSIKSLRSLRNEHD